MKVLLYGTDPVDAQLAQKMGQVFIVIAEDGEKKEYGPWDCNFMKLVDADEEERALLAKAGFNLLPA